MKLAIAVNLFLSRYDNRTTRRTYQDVLTPFVEALGSETPVQSIRPAMLIDYAATLRDKRGYALATRNKHVKSIKCFFNWLIAIEELEKSPAHAIKTRKAHLARPREKAMTDGELEAILKITWHKPRDYALIMFLADTGCRAGGAAGLKVNDIDFTARRAIVTEKGQKTRPVSFGEECAAALRKWLLRRRYHGEYVFSRRRHPLSSAQVGQVVRRACIAANIRSLGSHSLRHRKGHQFADARIAPSIAAAALGHSSVTITLEHYYPADYESAEKALQDLATVTAPQRIIEFKKEG